MPEIDDVELNRTGVRLTKQIIRTKGDPRAKEVCTIELYSGTVTNVFLYKSTVFDSP